MNEGYTGGIATHAAALISVPGAAASRPGRRVATALVTAGFAASVWLASVATACAQWLPSTPVTWFGGRLVVSGDASVAMSTSDHDTYFNYSDYQNDTMRLVRLGLGAQLKLGARVTAVAEVRSEGEVTGGPWRVYPISSFIRVRPSGGSSLSVAAGIIQPAFGAFVARRYGADNLLIGYPLAYQYATGVRADALPATADEVIRNRARGWSPRYSIGAVAGVSGLPAVNTTGWSPGVEVSAGAGRVSGTVAVTRGGLAAPGSASWDGRWEVTGRAEYRPTPGLVIGASGAHGGFIDAGLTPIVDTAAANRDPRESAAGADVEYSWGYWLVRAETILGWRTYPAFQAPFLNEPLRTVAFETEIRYKIRPGFYAAARFGHLAFSSIQGSTATTSWDANTSRVETGLGYSFTRNVLVKTVYQYNRRDSVRHPSLHLGAVQLVVTF
jgi:hypothetical protein